MQVMMKSDDGKGSLDTFIKQAIGKDPHVPYSITGDSPVQWIQLFHALDQPDIPGWPLFTPVKVQMLKCEKCSQEFCSPINYKRHIRVHRRSLNMNKEYHKNRDLLASFWDKFLPEQAAEIVSMNDVMLKEIPGSSILRALASSLHKPVIWSLPQVYVKAGSALFDIIHVGPSRLSISSQELFDILDDASEGTFLCAGTADAVQKYLFDGEAAKSSLELRNLVACTSFLFEQQLVKAWIADKDAEALRCHNLLVEEEEAAQKRRVALLERKKQKKLRQKGQKVKKQLYEDLSFDVVEESSLADVSEPPSTFVYNSNALDVAKILEPFLESSHSQSQDLAYDIEPQFDVNAGHTSNFQVIDQRMIDENDHLLAINNWQVPKSHRVGRNGFHLHKNVRMIEHEQLQKLCPTKGQNTVNASKVWTKKFKVKKDEESLKPLLQREIIHQAEETNYKVMIGSISVALQICDSHGHDCIPDKAQETFSSEYSMLENTVPEKLIQLVTAQSDSFHIEIGNEPHGGTMTNKILERLISDDRCVHSQPNDEANDCDIVELPHLLSDKTCQEQKLPFYGTEAKEFLSRRWKKAISEDNMKLIIAPGAHDQSDRLTTAQALKLPKISVLGNAENNLCRKAQGKSVTKTEKILKTRYMPKQKAGV